MSVPTHAPKGLPYLSHRTLAEVDAGVKQFTPDEIAVIRERHLGWEKAPCASLAKIFKTTPQRIAAICREG